MNYQMMLMAYGWEQMEFTGTCIIKEIYYCPYIAKAAQPSYIGMALLLG
jgi:hypothetical protein